MPAGRYQRWINTHIISAVLDRVRDEDGEPLFTLKGGAAMELRLGINARASKDHDGFAAMAADIGFYTDDVHVAADALRQFIAEIDAA